MKRNVTETFYTLSYYHLRRLIFRNLVISLETTKIIIKTVILNGQTPYKQIKRGRGGIYRPYKYACGNNNTITKNDNYRT